MKRLILFVSLIICSVAVFSQQLKVVDPLRKDAMSTDAIKYSKTDYSGNKCALIRMGLLLPNAKFEGDVFHSEYKNGEWWIYMTNGAAYIKILSNDYLPLEYKFPKPLESNATYVMTIEKPKGDPDPDVLTENFLVIKCQTPADAKIFINDEYEGRGEVSKYLPIYREHSYRVEAPLYHAEEGMVRLSADNTTVKTITLKPSFGYLEINTNPQGATIEINGEGYTQLTPFITQRLPSGVYTIKAFKEMYKEAMVQATVEDGGTAKVQIILEPNFGEVVLTLADGDAEVYVDNDYKGRGNWQGKVSIGTHRIEIKKDKHRTYAKTIVAQQGKTVRESIAKLEPICGRMMVNTTPIGAKIMIDGRDYGTSPKVIQGLLIGKHNVTLSKEGCSTIQLTVNIEEGKTAECVAELPQGNKVNIQTDKAGDALYVDGQYIGTSPMEVTLSFGNHKVEAERGGKRVSCNINVAEGDRQTITSNFFGNNTFTVKGVTFKMIAVKGGTYTMGATSEQGSDAWDNEKPAHKETVSDFMIGETEVTQELWQAVMGSNPSRFTGDLQRPVEMVSWNDCQEFIRKLNQLTGQNFRLPSEAEWEYAARGGNRSRGYKYAGGNDVGAVAWYGYNSGNTTHRVKTKRPNELGIYDMAGNVREWCQDKWCGDYNSPRVSGDRVLRGGRWDFIARCVRVSYRDGSGPGNGSHNFGLRLAL